jgi:hypothetical protein
MILTYREGEKSYKQFTQLAKKDKEKHVSFLLTLDPDILGYNDKYILLNFGPVIKKNNKFLNINDDYKAKN